MKNPPLITPAFSATNRTALIYEGQKFTYAELLDSSAKVARSLLKDQNHLNGERIGLSATAGVEHIILLWGIWRAGAVVAPISRSASAAEIAYFLEDAEISKVLCSEGEKATTKTRLPADFTNLWGVKDLPDIPENTLPDISPENGATLIYTSGTTSKPKGVVMTHGNLHAQVSSLVDAWAWSKDDCIPLCLPLHHVHGLINVLCCAMYCGAKTVCYESFDAKDVLKAVADKTFSVFMAVPTIYVKMIEYIDSLPEAEAAGICEGFKGMRLMVSGSAALPVSVHQRWQALTGQVLLERYGMTEIGMALSNPYQGERRPGTVGQPLPGVEICLRGEDGKIIQKEGVSGEILIKGPGVFSGYLNRPEATAEAFENGWFRSGDIAQWDDGYVRILGRSSIDIIKSGGYKLSALEIETHLLDHPDIREIAVVALPDDTWGETVAAAVVLQPGSQTDADALRNWSKEKMSDYKVPRRWILVYALPRNAMGKVMKPKVTEMILESL